jgi:RNA polymerase sigma-70 factor (ECF subfamily)
MIPAYQPDRRRSERRRCANEVVILFGSPGATITGKVIDISSCGCRVRHSWPGLNPGQVIRIRHGGRESEVRGIWVQHRKGRIESGLFSQEVYLINGLKAGEGELFAQLISPHMRGLRFAINSIVHNAADAEEVLQESLLKVVTHVHQFHLGRNFKAWLLQIATNEAFKYLRKNRRYLPGRIDLTDGQSQEELIEQFPDRRETPAEALERKEFIGAVGAALETMDEMYRQVFVLRDLQQMTMIKVAALLGINVDTANTRLHRARLQVRARLGGRPFLTAKIG